MMQTLKGMLLIGMFDSPFVRRVAISMTLLDMPFEHRNWSVGKDFDRIREYNPLGRVPVLVLDSGVLRQAQDEREVLVESAMILDYLDEQAGAARALLPAHGDARRRALHVMALITGATDKGFQLVFEQVFRPVDKHHAPWTDRCRGQMLAALHALDRLCAATHDAWLVGDALSQADITLGCYVTYLRDAVALDLAPMPALRERVERYESLPVFRQFYIPFDAPVPTKVKPA